MVKEIQHPITNYLPLLISGDANQLLELFAGEPIVDDPRAGHIQGVEKFQQFVATNQEWLRQHQERVEPVALTKNDTRAVFECILHLVQNSKQIPLPVAIVGDMHDNKITAIRVYHSMYPLIGKHYVRAPILAHQHSLTMPSVVACYQQALAKGDLETIVQQFEANGLAREPSGSKYFYQGTEKLRYFYAMLFSNNGGIPLQHCSITDDNTRCAIEYNVTDWGQTQLPAQAGVAVYEKGASGLLIAARIYDDVEPPLNP